MDGVSATNADGDRYAAEKVAKRQNHEGFTRNGFILHAVVAGSQRKTPEQITELVEKVGRGKSSVLHSGGDRMVAVELVEAFMQHVNAGLAEGSERVMFVYFEGAGHALAMDQRG